MSRQIVTPFEQFFDAVGTPLDNGSVYIGTPNLNPETNPVQVYWDDARTIPAAQPIKTSGGYMVRNGTPARVFADVENYSMTAKDKKGRIVWTVGDATSISTLSGSGGAALVGADDGAGGSIYTTIQGFLTKIKSSIGSSLVGFIQSGTGAVARTAQDKMRESVSVFDFMTSAEISDVQSGTATIDVTVAIQAAVNSLSNSGGNLYFPRGRYKITAQINILNKSNIRLFGVGFSGSYNSTNFCTTLQGTGPFTGLQFTNGVGCAVESLQLKGFGAALHFNFCLGFRVLNCNLRENQHGATFYGNGVGIVRANMIRDNTSSGLRFLMSTGDTVVTENDIGGNPLGLYVKSGGVHIHNNMIFYSNNAGYGAGVFIDSQGESADDPIRHSFITNNLFGRNDVAVKIQGNSLAYPSVESIIISENRIHQADDGGGGFDPTFLYGSGISITWAKFVSVKNNSFVGMRDYAVSAYQCEAGVYVIGNDIRDGSAASSSNGHGVIFNTVQWGRVEDNNFIGNTGTSVLMKCDLTSSFTQNNIIGNNTFQRNGAIYNEFDARTRANFVTDNLGGTLSDYVLNVTAPLTQIRHVLQGGNQETLKNQTLSLSNAAWNQSLLNLGSYNFWVDGTGRFRIKSGTPSSDTDGSVVGTQT